MPEEMKPGMDDMLPREADAVLSVEAVRAELRAIVGPEGKETVLRADADGVYLIEWTVRNERGEVTEYAYRRKGTFKEHGTSSVSIDVVYYDRDGMPAGGKVVADWKDGRWVRQG